MKASRFIIPVVSSLLTVSSALFGQETAYQPIAPAPPTYNSAFHKGSNVINAGLGVGGYYTYWGYGYSETPNFVISYDNGTFGNVGPGTISLGGLFSYKGISDNYIGNDGYHYADSWNYWILGFRSAYHLSIANAPKFDPYAGIMVGYYFLNHSFSTDNPHYSTPGNPGYVYYTTSYPNYVALSLYIGARYYVSNTVGLWGELSYGYSAWRLE